MRRLFFNKFPADLSQEENIERAYGQPFSASLERQAVAAGLTLKIDYRKLEKKLAIEPSSRALTVLRYQLKKYEKMFSAESEAQ